MCVCVFFPILDLGEIDKFAKKISQVEKMKIDGKVNDRGGNIVLKGGRFPASDRNSLLHL